MISGTGPWYPGNSRERSKCHPVAHGPAVVRAAGLLLGLWALTGGVGTRAALQGSGVTAGF